MKLALGTAQFGLSYGIANQKGQIAKPDAGNIVAAARAGGLDTLDTAIAYGSSETCLGSLGVRGWRIVTKLPSVPLECTNVDAWVKEQIAGSLQRLNVDRLYGLLLHDPVKSIGAHGSELVSALRSLCVEGLVHKIGVSIYSTTDLEQIYSEFQPDLVQAPLNLIDRTLVESGWLNRLVAHGVEVHTRSAFLQGLLLMQKVPSQFASWHELWDRWFNWQSAHPGKAIAACLAYPLAQAGIERVVVGVDNLVQLNELFAAVHNHLDAEELPDLGCTDELLINPSRWREL